VSDTENSKVPLPPFQRAGETVYLYSENFDAGFGVYARLAYQTVEPGGSFDFEGLEAGKYFVSVNPARRSLESMPLFACANPEDFEECEKLRAKEMEDVAKTPDEGPVTTWYPKATGMAGATPIVLGAGESQTANVTLAIRPLFHVSGEFGLPDEALNQIGTSLQEVDSGQTLPVWMARIHGAFVMGGVPPGRYIAKLTAPGLQATLPVTVTDHDIDGIKLIPQPELRVNGAFRMANPDTPLPDNLSLQFSWPLRGDSGVIPASPDGAFHLIGFPDNYSILPVLPNGYAATEIRYGGADYRNKLIPIKGDTTDPTLTILIGNQPSTVNGTIQEANAKIVLAPWPIPENFDLRSLRVAVPDEQSAFSFQGLPPGKYKAVVLTGDDRKRDHDISILHDKFAAADVFELTAGQNLTIVPKP